MGKRPGSRRSASVCFSPCGRESPAIGGSVPLAPGLASRGMRHDSGCGKASLRKSKASLWRAAQRAAL